MTPKYNFDETKNSLVLTFDGRLDTNYSLDVRSAIDNLLNDLMKPNVDKAFSVCFNFASVDFISSAFVGICVACAKKVGKESFSIVNTNPFIKRTFKIAGLDEQLNVQ